MGMSCQYQSLVLHCIPDADDYATRYANNTKLLIVVLKHVLKHVQQVYAH